MSRKKMLIGIAVMLCMAAIMAMALLHFSAGLVGQHLGLEGVSLIELARLGGKKEKGMAMLALAASFGLPVLVFGGILVAVFLPKKRELHGSARFANRQELVKSGLLQPDKPDDKYPSIVVGKMAEYFLLFRGQQFMFLAAPTRSGKGVGIVIPNLLHYRDSVVVLDIKDENFMITAGFRAACGQEVHRFAPDDETFRTSCWNPLGYVRGMREGEDGSFRVKDLMDITSILYPPSDDVWASTAESLFLGLALYVMDTKKLHGDFNIATLKKLRVTLDCLKDEETFVAHVEERKGLEPLSDDCIQHLRSYAQTSDKMRSSIAISFDQPLGMFSDPVAAKATAKNTFDLRDVRKKRMSIYVCIKPSSVDKFGKLLNLFFQQLLMLNMDKLPQDDPENLKYQCLLLLDEFPAMGRVAIVEKASAYMAGYNMRLLIIAQSKSQIQDRKLYDVTGAQTMLTNMALQIYYAPREQQDANDASEMIGYMTQKEKSVSRSFGGKGGGGGSISESGQRRAVLLPQEVKDIGMDHEIIALENTKPALVKKIFWYKEPVFQARANMPPPAVPCQKEPNTIEKAPDSVTKVFEGTYQETALPVGATFEVGLSPNRNALQVVMSLILQAQKEILVAAYSFTSKDIVVGLLEARRRGVDVRVVVDDEQNKDSQSGYKAVDALLSENIPLRRNANYACMHHKFMVVDGAAVQLGSFNYTASANTRNAETAIVFRNAPALAEIYRTEWFRLFEEPGIGQAGMLRLDVGLNALEELGF